MRNDQAIIFLILTLLCSECMPTPSITLFHIGLPGQLQRMVDPISGAHCMVDMVMSDHLHDTKVLRLVGDCISVQECLSHCLHSESTCIGISYVAEVALCKLFAFRPGTFLQLWGEDEFVGMIKGCSPEFGHPRRPQPTAVQGIACGRPRITPKRIQETHRIVGGVEARPHSLPWMVAVLVDDEPRCGGALISLEKFSNHSSLVLTAAHCLFKDIKFFPFYMMERVPASFLQVLVGTHSLRDERFEPDAQVIPVQSTAKHPHYSIKKYGNDIALLKLRRPVSYTDIISPVCLPERGASLPAVGTDCLISGWGLTSEEGWRAVRLRQAYVPILPDHVCLKAYRGVYIPELMACAGYVQGGIDSCQGDSGGPFVCFERDSWYIHGVVSFGFGCARYGQPGIYTRVTSYTDWIRQQAYRA